MSTVIGEFEVLKATALWLNRDGWDLTAISVSRGGRISEDAGRAILSRDLQLAGLASSRMPDFFTDGPDIVATRSGKIWKIECKGHGTGQKSTLRTQFQRAVGSVVSYLDSPDVQLGLALPHQYLFDYKWGRRLPFQLRKACNMWVLLYEDGEITPFEPESHLPPD
jgi:hypothetical protein